MVPFAEVVLLTAMEYHRMDVSHILNEEIPMEMDIESQEKDASEEKGCKSCWIPQLKTLGDMNDIFFTHMKTMNVESCNIFFQRKEFCRPWCWRAL